MRQTHPLRILIADDVAEWRVKARSLLEARTHWQVIGEACDGLQAVQRTADLFPELVLLDIGMPILNGIEAARKILKDCPMTKVIFLTQENDPDVRKAALGAGAAGYLLKMNASTELVPTIEAAYRLSIAPVLQ